MEKIEKIKLPLIKEYLKTIRSLAGQGRNYYHKYLIVPLSSWTSVPVDGELEEMMRDIKVFTKLKDFKRLAAVYKRSICRSVEKDQFDLTIPGKLCMEFLKQMQESVDLANSLESLQLINILRKPFWDYSAIEYKQMNNRFQDELASSASEERLLSALKTISQEEQEQIKAEKALSQKLAAEFKRKVGKLPIAVLRHDAISYLLRVATPNNPQLHLELDPLIERIETSQPGFRREVYETVAVLIYREVMKTIKSGDIRKTVILISKYTVLFRGDPATPHYQELDAFEKMFFAIIDKKNLWEHV